MRADKKFFSKELDLHPNRNSKRHTNKRKETQTFLETLGSRNKGQRLRCNTEVTTYQMGQN
jgi:hypothetical protein